MKEVEKGLSGRHPAAAKPAELYTFEVLVKRYRLNKSQGTVL